jgi:nicotinamide-nucleotide amidase
VSNGDADVRAGIVVTGTELLTGQLTDRNGPWLAQQLGELGVEVAHLLCVGDRSQDLAAALRFLAGQGVDLIVTSGGLGPTADDLTAEVVARFAGVPLELDEAMEQQIAAILARFRHLSHFSPEALRAANRKQAMVPRGAEPLDPIGTAPGLVISVPSSCRGCGLRPCLYPPPGRCWRAPDPSSQRGCGCSGCLSRRSRRRCAK